MTENTHISWATHTFNPWVGCTKVSPGCDNCYAETLSRRSGVDVWGQGKDRRHTVPSYWRKPHKWEKDAIASGERPRVFPSMCDPFDAEVDDTWRRHLWEVIEQTPHVDWLLLTKRPNLIRKAIPSRWLGEPPANVWYGTSVERADYAWRIDALINIPATLRFLSIEPLIGPVAAELQAQLWTPPGVPCPIHWIIVGGESGSHRRPMQLEWAEDIRQQCAAHGVPFWFKQISAFKPGQGEDALGAVYQELPR